MSTHHISKFWRAWRDYSARPCASPLRGGLWPFKIAPDNFVEPVRSRVISTKRLAEAVTADSKIIFIKIIYSDLQVGRYSNWDVSRQLIKLSADIFRRAIKQRYPGVTL